MDLVQKKLDILNKEVENIPYLGDFCKKLGIPPAILIFGIAFILLLIILFGFAGNFLTRFIGVVYPSFKSI